MGTVQPHLTMPMQNPLDDVQLAFIGAGAMGEALIGGLLAAGRVAPGQLTATDARPERLEEMRGKFEVQTGTDNRAAARAGDVVVLAVKPQVLPAVLAELRGAIRGEALVLSIVAGATIESIAAGVGHRGVVRTMPNTPAQIGEGMTVWTATPEVSPAQRAQAQAIVGAFGRELYVTDERFLDMATAVSGSGPAYAFLFIEAFIDAAVHLGWPRPQARELVMQTLRGSVLFAERSAAHPAELRSQVTSPGGTTAAAVYELEKGALRTAVSEAVRAAYERSVALGRRSDD